MARRDSAPSSGTVRLRLATREDEPFLYAVYASTRAEELALVDWDDSQKSAFLQMQFTAQHRYYHEQFADAAFQVIECSGTAVGRLYVARGPSEIRIIDIALLPPYRNRGIGSWLIRQLQGEAASTGKRLSIHVERMNPALQLYTRLGFQLVADQGVYLLMEWAPVSASAR